MHRGNWTNQGHRFQPWHTINPRGFAMGVFAFVIRTRGGVAVASAVWFILACFSRNRDNSPALNFYFSTPPRPRKSSIYVFDPRLQLFRCFRVHLEIDRLIAPLGAVLTRLLLDRLLIRWSRLRGAPPSIRDQTDGLLILMNRVSLSLLFSITFIISSYSMSMFPCRGEILLFHSRISIDKVFNTC